EVARRRDGEEFGQSLHHAEDERDPDRHRRVSTTAGGAWARSPRGGRSSRPAPARAPPRPPPGGRGRGGRPPPVPRVAGRTRGRGPCTARCRAYAAASHDPRTCSDSRGEREGTCVAASSSRTTRVKGGTTSYGEEQQAWIRRDGPREAAGDRAQGRQGRAPEG